MVAPLVRQAFDAQAVAGPHYAPRRRGVGQDADAQSARQPDAERGGRAGDGDLGAARCERVQLEPGVDEAEPALVPGDRLAGEQRDDRLHGLGGALTGGFGGDPEHVHVRDHGAGAAAQDEAAPGHVVELDGPVGDQEGVVVRQRGDAGRELDPPGALGRRRDEQLRCRDGAPARRVVLPDPQLLVVQRVDDLGEFEVALVEEGRVLTDRVQGGDETAEAHGDPLTRLGGDGRTAPASGHSARAMAARWIWLVPSMICRSFASRIHRSTGWSWT